MTSIKLELHLKGKSEFRRLPVTDYESLCVWIRKLTQQEINELRIEYLDNEEDWVVFDSPSEFAELLLVSKVPIRIRVFSAKNENEKKNCCQGNPKFGQRKKKKCRWFGGCCDEKKRNCMMMKKHCSPFWFMFGGGRCGGMKKRGCGMRKRCGMMGRWQKGCCGEKKRSWFPWMRFCHPQQQQQQQEQQQDKEEEKMEQETQKMDEDIKTLEDDDGDIQYENLEEQQLLYPTAPEEEEEGEDDDDDDDKKKNNTGMFEKQLSILRRMGFKDDNLNIYLLHQNNGDVKKVLSILLK